MTPHWKKMSFRAWFTSSHLKTAGQEKPAYYTTDGPVKNEPLAKSSTHSRTAIQIMRLISEETCQVFLPVSFHGDLWPHFRTGLSFTMIQCLFFFVVQFNLEF